MKCRRPTREARRCLLYGFGMIAAPAGNTPMLRLCAGGRGSIQVRRRRPLLRGHLGAAHALDEQITRPRGCSASSTAQRLRRRTGACGRRAWRRCRRHEKTVSPDASGIASDLGDDARRFVADVAGPGQRQAALRRAAAMTLGRGACPRALAGQDLVADDQCKPKFMVRVQVWTIFVAPEALSAAATSSTGVSAIRSVTRGPCTEGCTIAHRLLLGAAQARPRTAEAVVREPQRGESEDERVEPDHAHHARAPARTR